MMKRFEIYFTKNVKERHLFGKLSLTLHQITVLFARKEPLYIIRYKQ